MNTVPVTGTVTISVKAWRCPRCTALLSESITGALPRRARDLRCAECGVASPLSNWTPGIWTQTPEVF